MGRVRGLVRRALSKVAGRVARDDLFEQPGERAPQAPLPPLRTEPSEEPAVQAAPVAASAEPRPVEGGLAVMPGVPHSRRSQCTIAGLNDLQKAVLGEGPVRVVNHWATWCIPCVEEFDVLKTLAAELPEGVPLFGVSWDLFDPRGDEDDIEEHVENFGAGHDLPWPTLLISETVAPPDLFSALTVEVEQVPQTWVVGADGRVLHRVHGVLDDASAAEVVAAVRAAVK